MTASSDLSVREQRIVEALRPFFGSDADALFEAHGRSLQLLTHLRGSRRCQPVIVSRQGSRWRRNCWWRN